MAFFRHPLLLFYPLPFLSFCIDILPCPQQKLLFPISLLNHVYPPIPLESGLPPGSHLASWFL